MEFELEPPPPSQISSGARPTRGIDVLGVRLPVQDVGAELLDGVTTVTQTIRYLGLRAWTARRYALARLPNAWGPFSEFAGRVEAAVAIGNLLVDPGTPGLIGSDRAFPVASSGAETFDLEKLVAQTAAAIYAGASEQLLLTYSDGEAVPGLSPERGLPLYQAIDATLGCSTVGRELARDPQARNFSRDALAEVGQIYSMRAVGGREGEALLAALLPGDPLPREISRMGSYALILELALRHTRSPTKSDVFASAVARDADLPTYYGPWLDGWARYLVRDMLAVVHEAVLAAVTGELEARAQSGAMDGAAIIRSLLSRADEFDEPLTALGLLPKGTPAQSWSVRDLANSLSEAQGETTDGPIRRWSGTIDEEAIIRCALSAGAGALSLAPLAWLMARSRIGQPSAKGLGARGMSRSGETRLGIVQVVLPGVKSLLEGRATLYKAANELAWQTVQQHLSIAWARLAADPRLDVACMSTDGSRWSLRRSFIQGRTGARLTRAIAWTEQLGLIDSSGCTELGRRVLDRLRTQLSVAKVAS